MRRTSLLLLLLTSTLLAETPAERFKAAYTQWAAHRPDGMTWDDDSAIAVEALNTMWSAAGQVGVDFLATHSEASAKDLSEELASLLPVSDPRFGPPLSADSLEIKPGLFLVAFNSYPAGAVFAIARKSQRVVLLWNLSLGGAQSNDSRHLLASWHASRAGDTCVTQHTYASGVCGPMTSVSLGTLPLSRSGQPRFFIRATYSKDMGGTDDEQISVWSLTNDIPTLEWINLYVEGGEEETVPNGVEYKDGMLLIAEKHEFNTFPSCGSCSGRQMIHRIRVTPDGLQDQGLGSVHPELDAIDNLFQKIANGQPTTGLASPQVANFLRPHLVDAEKEARQIDPNSFSVGMLSGFTFSSRGKISVLCFQSDELGPVDFTLEGTANGYFVSHVSERPNAKQCGGAL
jgi:hypothetical protein